MDAGAARSWEAATTIASPSGSPSTGTVRGLPLLAPTVLSMITGSPVTRLARVWRPFVTRNTGRSKWWSVRAQNQAIGAVAACQRINRYKRLASSYLSLSMDPLSAQSSCSEASMSC